MKFEKYLTEEQTYERVAREDPTRGLTVSHGEAGVGVYAYPAPNKKMRNYYSKSGLPGRDKLVRFTVSGLVVDLTKEVNKLIEFAKEEFDKMAQSMKYYQKPKVNKSNIQRFPHIIYSYMADNYPNASGYIVLHKAPGIPTGKQVVVTKPEKIKILSIEGI